MNLDQFRREMTAYWEAVNNEARTLRDPYYAVDRLYALYRKFDAEDRALADHVIAEWALSHDENMSYDARLMIHKFKITRALPALEKVAKRLASSSEMGAPYELKRINRLMAHLRQ
jgi:hypothetical protein